jgi:hypothetical protein
MDALVPCPPRRPHSVAVRRHDAPLIATVTAKRPPEGNHRESWYLYDIEFEGELVVRDSKDPECELARALRARGVTGTVTLVDANGPRITINIEKCAKLTVRETRSHGPRFVKWRPNPFGAQPE